SSRGRAGAYPRISGSSREDCVQVSTIWWMDTDSAGVADDRRREPVGPPPSQSKGEVVEGLARAAVSATPIVGGPVAELLGLVVDPVIHRRYNAWLRHLSEAVDDMLAHDLDI